MPTPRFVPVLLVAIGVACLGSGNAQGYEIIAQRGVHQPFDKVVRGTCEADTIRASNHEFLENTIPSMREAFRYGATMVEIDFQLSSDGHLVIFHDIVLDCKTNGSGLVAERPLAYLKTLDAGYRYTFDGGKSFPWRGKAIGMIPTLAEVLREFPKGRFLLNQKDNDAQARRDWGVARPPRSDVQRELTEALAKFLDTLSTDQRSRLFFWAKDASHELLYERIPDLGFPRMPSAAVRQDCLRWYALLGWSGYVPNSCHHNLIWLPETQLDKLWGWPDTFMQRMHESGSAVLVKELNTPDDLERCRSWPVDGAKTRRVEEMGDPIRNWLAGR